jgi:hypothetical protein
MREQPIQVVLRLFRVALGGQVEHSIVLGPSVAFGGPGTVYLFPGPKAGPIRI